MNTRSRTGYRFVLCPLAFGLALALAGCGLSDYLGHMSSEAARVRQWDEETLMLGPPVTMPELPKKGDKEQRWYVFLRLPNVVTDKPTVAPDSTLAQLTGPMAHYAGGNNKLGILNVYLGVAIDQKDFVSTVYSQFGGSAGKDQVVTIARSPVLLAAASRSVPAEIAIKRGLFETQSLYSVNVYEHDKTQVAVVFQMEKGNGAKADAAIKASLATLGEGEDEAAVLQRAYDKTNRKVKK